MSGSEIKDVGASGTFRLYAHDNPIKLGKLASLRVPAGNGKYVYWIEYRTAYSSDHVDTRHSAGMRLENYFSGGKTALLDLTPGSRSPDYDFNDAHLDVGKEFKDPFGNFTLKTLGVNEGVWDENGWVDVQVTWTGNVAIRVPARGFVAGGIAGLPTLLADGNGRLLPAPMAGAGIYFLPASASSAPPRILLK
jgi:hypothetical protein